MTELLRRERLRLLVVIDGIDEVHDYDTVARGFGSFVMSALARHARVVVTCRQEAVRSISTALRELVPDVVSATRHDAGPIVLEELDRDEASDLLRRSGANPVESREIESRLGRAPVGSQEITKALRDPNY